jgi:hypothetical protein
MGEGTTTMGHDDDGPRRRWARARRRWATTTMGHDGDGPRRRRVKTAMGEDGAGHDGDGRSWVLWAGAEREGIGP